MVGDTKQSIYAFRGAEVEVFLATERELAEAGGERMELTESFRAVDALVAAINPVTEGLLGAAAVHARGSTTPSGTPCGRVASGDGRARAELLLVTECGAEAVGRAEAEAIARWITELAVEHTPPEGAGAKSAGEPRGWTRSPCSWPFRGRTSKRSSGR